MFLRYLLWKKRTNTAKLSAKPDTLRYLLPTDSVLELNIKPAHYHSILWHSYSDGRTSRLDPYEVINSL